MSMAFSNILIVKLSAIGDVIHALPVAHALKQCYPNAKISWMVEKAAAGILSGNPDIDEILLFDKPQFKSLSGLLKNGRGLSRELRKRQFGLALDLQGLFKSAAVAYLSGARHRYVYQNAREGSSLLAHRVVGPHEKGHVVEQYLDVVRELGCLVEKAVFPIAFTEQEKQAAEKIARWQGLNITQPYIVLSPGANWPNKRWPAAHFATLADRLGDKGIPIVLTGGPDDAVLADEIKRITAIPPVDLTGKTSLKELAWLIKQSDVFIGGDTGPMHLAAALGTPVVALYGPTDTVRNGPYGQGNIALIAGRDCVGCWKRRCRKGLDCLAAIQADDAFAAVEKILANHGKITSQTDSSAK